jgi:DNA-binding MarR family transcriptional regulator
MAARRAARNQAARIKPQKAAGRSPALALVMYKVHMLRRLIERYANPTIPDRYGTTVAEWRVLTHLYFASPMTATELSMQLAADKAEISRACNSLIAKGHVSRRADRSDARSTRLILNQSGIVLHDRILPLRQALEDEMRTVLGTAESKAFHRSLDKLIQYFAGKIAAAPVVTKPAKAAKAARAAPAAGERRSSASDS